MLVLKPGFEGNIQFPFGNPWLGIIGRFPATPGFPGFIAFQFGGLDIMLFQAKFPWMYLGSIGALYPPFLHGFISENMVVDYY